MLIRWIKKIAGWALMSMVLLSFALVIPGLALLYCVDKIDSRWGLTE